MTEHGTGRVMLSSEGEEKKLGLKNNLAIKTPNTITYAEIADTCVRFLNSNHLCVFCIYEYLHNFRPGTSNYDPNHIVLCIQVKGKVKHTNEQTNMICQLNESMKGIFHYIDCLNKIQKHTRC